MLFGRKKRVEEAAQRQAADDEKQALLAKAAEAMPGDAKGREFSAKVRENLQRAKELDLKRERATVAAKQRTTGERPVTENGQDANGANDTIFTEPTPGASPSGRNEGEEGGKTVANMLGEITWLMSQSPAHKNFFISDLEWMVMTPILLKQFRVFYAKDRPIGVVFWAQANEEVAQRLAAGNARLKPQDWKSGDDIWVVDVIAPYGGTDEMLKDFKAHVFADREFRYLAVEDGQAVVRGM